MKVKSTDIKWVRKNAGDAIDLTQADVEALARAMDDPIDTSDIPEGPIGTLRGERDEQGRLIRYPKGRICQAILEELGRRQMTRYQLWQEARKHCATLPDSAVYEYLRGKRQIGAEYIEALLKALDLEVRPAKKRRTG